MANHELKTRRISYAINRAHRQLSCECNEASCLEYICRSSPAPFEMSLTLCSCEGTMVAIGNVRQSPVGGNDYPPIFTNKRQPEVILPKVAKDIAAVLI